jgi:hypothetical protein
VQIFHHQEQWLLLTGTQMHVPQRRKGALFDGFRRQLVQGLRRDGAPQELEEIRRAGLRQQVHGPKELVHPGGNHF